MSGLAFWTNIMFVLLACARGWAALTLYKTQEEDAVTQRRRTSKAKAKRRFGRRAFLTGARCCRLCCGGVVPAAEKRSQTTLRPRAGCTPGTPTPPCPPGSGGRCG